MNEPILIVNDRPSQPSRSDRLPVRFADFRGWLPLLALPALVFIGMPTSSPRWVRMWAVAVVVFFGCKWLTWRRSSTASSLQRQFSYFFAWPRLEANAFLDSHRYLEQPSILEWLFAITKLTVGLILFFYVAARVSTRDPYLVGWIGMIGIVMILHFGLFHLLSCAWRSAGVKALPLMSWLGTAVRLTDFWGKRWNTAFRDLTHRFLFRPLVARFGARGSLLIGFVFSGLIHDAVISLPAGGGYGGPTVFFAMQGLGLFFERSKIGRRLGTGAGIRGWLFTMACLVLPAPLLFHRPFVIEIIVPFMYALGAI